MPPPGVLHLDVAELRGLGVWCAELFLEPGRAQLANAGTHLDASAATLCVARVLDEVEERTEGLVPVCPGPDLGDRVQELDPDLFCDQWARQPNRLGGDLSQLQRGDVRAAVAREGEELAHERSGALGGELELAEREPRRAVFGELVPCQLCVAPDGLQQVVEVMCDTAGQQPEPVELPAQGLALFLGVELPLCGLVGFLPQRPPGGCVSRHGAAEGHGHQEGTHEAGLDAVGAGGGEGLGPE
jgi:hypothetical protein